MDAEALLQEIQSTLEQYTKEALNFEEKLRDEHDELLVSFLLSFP